MNDKIKKLTTDSITSEDKKLIKHVNNKSALNGSNFENSIN